MNLWLLSTAWAGPNTVMLGVDGDFSAEGMKGLRCLAQVPVCLLKDTNAELDALRALPGVRYAEADAPIAWQPPVAQIQIPPPWDAPGPAAVPPSGSWLCSMPRTCLCAAPMDPWWPSRTAGF